MLLIALEHVWRYANHGYRLVGYWRGMALMEPGA